MKVISALLLLPLAATPLAAGETVVNSLAPARFHCHEMTLPECTRARVELLRELSRHLRDLAAHPREQGLSREETKELDRFNEWLGANADKADLLLSGGAATSSDLMNATKQMQESQMSFNLQYLMLQEAMQNDSRQYSAVSAAMKARHDALMGMLAELR